MKLTSFTSFKLLVPIMIVNQKGLLKGFGKTFLLKKSFPEKPAEKNLDKSGTFMVKSKIADK